MPLPEKKAAISHAPISMGLPVHNQAALVERALPAWATALGRLHRPFEILVVDDGSTDGSFERAQAVAERTPEVRVHRFDSRQGFGAALKFTIDHTQHPLFFYTSLDYPYQTSDLPKLLERIDDVDFVSGFRSALPTPGVARFMRTISWWAMRILVGYDRESPPGWLGWKSHVYARFMRTLMGVHLNDIESAYKLYRRELLGKIHIQATGPFVHTEIVAKANFLTCWMEEVPIGAQGGVPAAALAIPFRIGERWSDFRRVMQRPDFGTWSAPVELAPPAAAPAAI